MKNFFCMFRICCVFFLSSIFILTTGISQANYEEHKVKPYDLPSLLESSNGLAIKTSKSWENNQRDYFHKLLEHQVYGKFPMEDIHVKFRLRSVHELSYCDAIQKNVDIIFTNGNDDVVIDLVIFLPAKAQKPIPLFMGLNFFGNHTIHPSPFTSITNSWTMNKVEFDIKDHRVTESSRGVRANRWPVERIINRGYGLAVMYYGDIDPDYDDDFENGIHSLLSEQSKHIPEGISSISAWAAGLSAALDYCEEDDAIDEESVAVIGHSRLGKAALCAGAHDERFAMVISNNSGCVGAALSRRQFGETVKVINTRFPHWFSKNYRKVNDRESEQTFDQHTLLSLIAPRPLYVGSAKEDEWADPYGEYLSLFYAAQVYKLYGGVGFTDDNLPAINEPLISGNMAYHIRTGKHDLTKFDWERYIDFVDQVLK